MEEKFIGDQITGDTYDRWTSTYNTQIFSLKAAIQRMGTDMNKAFKILARHLHLITDMKHVYTPLKYGTVMGPGNSSQLRVKAVACAGRNRSYHQNNLGPYFSTPLEITQLFFGYEKPIGISFKIDKERFDLEKKLCCPLPDGKETYDKILIKDAIERFIPSGKIAIVYFNSTEAIEYIGTAKT